MPFSYPDITEHGAEPCVQNADRLQIDRHRHMGKAVGEQLNRIVQPIICEVVDVLPAAQMQCKIREKFSGGVKTGSEIFRNGKVLVAPVCLRAVDRIRIHQMHHQNHNRQKQR